MRANKLFKRPKAENGAGRAVKIKHILLPEEVVEDLKLFKDSYTEVLGTKVTFEQMFRRWMDQVSRFDPDVLAYFLEVKNIRKDGAKKVAEGLGLTVEQLEENRAAFDPTEGEVWELSYYFEKEGEDDVEAHVGDKTAFYAIIDGHYIGITQMLAEGWTLHNEIGIELDIDQAWKIRNAIKEHQAKK